MRRVVSVWGTAFVLLCIVLVLVAAPVGAEDSGSTPPGASATDGQYKPVDDQYKPIDKALKVLSIIPKALCLTRL